MKLTRYEDVNDITDRRTVLLREDDPDLPDIELTLEALPPDWDDEVERELPSPNPPRVGVEKKSSGRPVFDPDTGRPVPRYDEHDEGFLRERREINKLQSVKMVVDGLADGEVAFDATFDPNNPRDYYRDVLREMKEFGFGMGDLVTVIEEIGELSGISEDELDRAKRDFFETED